MMQRMKWLLMLAVAAAQFIMLGAVPVSAASRAMPAAISAMADCEQSDSCCDPDAADHCNICAACVGITPPQYLAAPSVLKQVHAAAIPANFPASVRAVDLPPPRSPEVAPHTRQIFQIFK